MTYIASVFEFLFGCHHGNLSRVFTINGRSYRVCCDCGTQFGYSLATMSIQRPDSPHRQPYHVLDLNGAQ